MPNTKINHINKNTLKSQSYTKKARKTRAQGKHETHRNHLNAYKKTANSFCTFHFFSYTIHKGMYGSLLKTVSKRPYNLNFELVKKYPSHLKP